MITNKFYMGDGIVELPDHFYVIATEDSRLFTGMKGETLVLTRDLKQANLYADRDIANGMIQNGVKERKLIEQGHKLKVVAVVKDFRLI